MVYDDKIEAYLTGKMDASDKLAFEAGMDKDPQLKSEVELQNDIIESLKNTRKIQLKTRLNNIDVTSVSSGVSSAVKVAASFITVGLIGAGVYYMTVLSNKENLKEETVISTENLIVEGSDNDNNTEVINQETKVKPETNSTKQKRTKDAKVLQENQEEITVKANVPNGGIDTESDRIKDKSIELPNGGIVEATDRKSVSPDISIDDKNKSDFSYKYYSNKLFLYGNFKDQPFNVVEINTPKVKQLYLLYEGKYYELKSNQTKATRLKEVKDASVLEQLSNKNK